MAHGCECSAMHAKCSDNPMQRPALQNRRAVFLSMPHVFFSSSFLRNLQIAILLLACGRGLAGVLEHASPVPPASGYASIDDVSRFPLRGKTASGFYRRYLQASAPKALAISRSGAMSYRGNSPAAMTTALAGCRKNSPVSRCQLYAVDDDVVYAPDEPGQVAVRMFISEEDDWSRKVRERWLPEVQKIADRFVDATKEVFGVSLNDNVVIYVTSSGYDFRKLMTQEMKMKETLAENTAWLNGGVSNGRGQIGVVFHASSKIEDAHVRAMKSTLHELIHELQSQLAGGQSGFTARWLREGSADLYAYRLLASMKLESSEVSRSKWKKRSVQWLKGNSRAVEPEALLYTVSLSDWQKLMDEQKGPYQVSALMVLHLEALLGTRFDRAWIKYFGAAVQRDFKEEEAFESCFGMTLSEFVASFKSWAKTL